MQLPIFSLGNAGGASLCSSLCIGLVFFASCTRHEKYNQWRQYKGSDENIQYSSLIEIDTSNVKTLQPAWEYHTGDADTANYSQIQCNPIIVDGILYGTSPRLKLFALDAATGEKKWQFDPFDSLNADKSFFSTNNCRGVTYYKAAENNQRIYYTAGSFLHCVNAQTGRLVESFANKGKLDLHDGLGAAAKDLFVSATSPGIVFNHLIIMGTRVSESPQAAPGHIRAFDINTENKNGYFIPFPNLVSTATRAGRIQKPGSSPEAPMPGAVWHWIKKER